MRPPRTLVVRYPYGHPLGEAGRPAQHRAILRRCLELVVTLDAPGAIVEGGYRWRRDRFPGE